MYFVNVKYMLSKKEIFSDTNQLKYCDGNESFPETNTNLTPKYVLHICVSSRGINHPSGMCTRFTAHNKDSISTVTPKFRLQRYRKSLFTIFPRLSWSVFGILRHYFISLKICRQNYITDVVSIFTGCPKN